MAPETDGERIVRLETQMAGVNEKLSTMAVQHKVMGEDIKTILQAINLGKGKAIQNAKLAGYIIMAGGFLTFLWDHLLSPLLGKH